MAGSLKPGNVSTRQARIAENARRHSKLKSIAHHMDALWMREAFKRTRKGGAAGIDGVRASDYAERLDENLDKLLARAKTGDYRAPAVRRVLIPKGKGKTRPLGIPTFEDKVLQRAVLMLLEPVFEQNFFNFSYGFRPKRGAHDALDALRQGIQELVYANRAMSCWVLDADLKAFFDTIPHKKLQEVLGLRVEDGVVRRLVGKWLNAGILEEGKKVRSDTGTPQGGVLSPLLANMYLHRALDGWWVRTMQPRLQGRSLMVRYADDFVMVFSRRDDAERVQKELYERLAEYGLTLNSEKTKLIAFHRPRRNRKEPGTFTMLGITHYWGKSRKGRWAVRTRTSKESMARGILRVAQRLKRIRHKSLRDQAVYLRRALLGHYNYFGKYVGERNLRRYMWIVRGIWRKWLSRRSQKGGISWKRMRKILRRHKLPLPPKWKPTPKAPKQHLLANL